MLRQLINEALPARQPETTKGSPQRGKAPRSAEHCSAYSAKRSHCEPVSKVTDVAIRIPWLAPPIGSGALGLARQRLREEMRRTWLQPLRHTAERDTPCDTSPYTGEVLPLGHRGEASVFARDLTLTVLLSLRYIRHGHCGRWSFREVIIIQTSQCFLLASGALWEPEWEGPFFSIGPRLYFAAKERRELLLFIHEDAALQTRRIQIHGLDLPSDWMLWEDKSLLLCGENAALDLRSLAPCACPDEQTLQAYQQRKKSWGQHLVNDSFRFGDYTVSHEGQCGFVCTRGGAILWKLRCRGYLYADIQMAGDCVLILTAGAGGHFYAVRLTTGEVLCDINNGGTKQFVLDVDRVYLLSRKGGSRALAVSTKDWKPLWEESLQHTVSTSSRFAVRDGVLYAVTFRYKNRLPAEAYLETLPLR